MVAPATAAIRDNGASVGGTPEIRKGSLWRKESPISHALTNITPWIPNVIKNERIGSFVKFLIPSQVVQPEAMESTRAVAPTSIKRQFIRCSPPALSVVFCTFGRHNLHAAIPLRNASRVIKIHDKS